MEHNIGEDILRFIAQANSKNLKTRYYPKTFNSYKVELSFGKGSAAKTPWFAFLKDNNLIYKGIYPVFLLYKEEQLLILAFGVSETMTSEQQWKLPSEYQSIKDHFRKENYKQPKYGKSFIYKKYDLNMLEKEVLLCDLEKILEIYEKNPS